MGVAGRPLLICKDKVLEYLRERNDKRMKGKENGCCGCERKTTFNMIEHRGLTTFSDNLLIKFLSLINHCCNSPFFLLDWAAERQEEEMCLSKASFPSLSTFCWATQRPPMLDLTTAAFINRCVCV